MKRLLIIFACASILLSCGTRWAHSWAKPAQSPASAVKPPVYVYDFELDVAPPSSGNQGSRAVVGSPLSGASSVVPATQQAGAKKLSPEQEKRKHASELVDWMSASLIAELQKAGYGATRLPVSDGRPGSGVAIRGIFTEVDAGNRWRRAVIRSADDSGKMHAVVSVVNLAKPDQALYEIAPLPGNEARLGAVITLSPYVPLTKYDVDKKADRPAFQAIASSVVKDLTALLAANPSALTQ